MAKQQIHKRLSKESISFILKKYLSGEIRAKGAREKLGLGKSRFYDLVKEYNDNGDSFDIDYSRSKPTRKISPDIEDNILRELDFEKTKIISNPNIPTNRYNYSYIKNLLRVDYGQDVSVSTIINRAKKNGFHLGKPPKKKHNREVLTNFVGELIQHDSSHHLFAPDSGVKWYLITSIDDYSRKILYADLWEAETSFAHILSVQNLVLRYGIPHSYYTDQHSIFRYVKDRDQKRVWSNYSKFTDDVDPQWKQVLKTLKIELIYALSPQAKGKIERPYGWLQDHLVRTFVRKGVTEINEGRKILREEVYQYNHKRIHSTTREVPDIRFNQAIYEGKTLFQEFKLIPPYKSAKDIFCLRDTRKVDAYKNISFQNNTFNLPKTTTANEVELRIYPTPKLTEIRFWDKGKNEFICSKTIESSKLSTVHF